MNAMRVSVLIAALLCGALGFSTNALSAPHFVPNDQEFWDNSENWTTEYGPAYRDTVEKLENMVPCTGQFALCFTSGPEPLPCEITKDGRFANCTCTAQSGLNFVLITAILNYQVYQDTVAVCGADGSGLSWTSRQGSGLRRHQIGDAYQRGRSHFHLRHQFADGDRQQPCECAACRLSQGTLRCVHDRPVQGEKREQPRMLVSGILWCLSADAGGSPVRSGR